MYLIFGDVNGYFEEINRNEYITLHFTKKSKEIKKSEELWIKMRDLIRSITKGSGDYYGQYMKIKFDSDDELRLIKTVEVSIMAIVVRAVFFENNKYYPHDVLDEYLYKI